jgi:hypothetical protein
MESTIKSIIKPIMNKPKNSTKGFSVTVKFLSNDHDGKTRTGFGCRFGPFMTENMIVGTKCNDLDLDYNISVE